ncbi:DUF1972 domain-containing protein [Flavitalea flava]
MKIGILGTRGIPNAYGGFEQFAQYLAIGLQKKGYEISVYNSSDHPYKSPNWNGISIIHCKDWEHRIGTAGQFIYDYNCFIDARQRNYDVLIQLGYTSNSIWHWIWPKKPIHIINMDGLEWKRSKYNKPVQKFLQTAERLAVKYASLLVSDSPGIRDYLLEKYNQPSVYIPYGAEIPAAYNPSFPAEWGLEPGDYHLIMARMEPENNIEMIIKGWISSRQSKPLVIIGNSGNKFGQYLTKNYQYEKLRFIGAIYDQPVVNALRHYSDLYFHGHSVGGTNPSLLEAMACECNIAAHDNPFNKAILNEDAFYFSSPEQVREVMDKEDMAGDNGNIMMEARKEKNIMKIRTLYNWGRIIDEYEKVILNSVANQI